MIAQTFLFGNKSELYLPDLGQQKTKYNRILELISNFKANMCNGMGEIKSLI